MATQNLSSGTGIRGWEGPFKGDQFILHSTVDFTVTAGGSADVLQMIAVPAGTLVTNVAHIVLTAEDSTSTGTIGDGSGATSWIASVNNEAAANTVLFGNGKFALSEGTPNTIASTHAYAADGGKYYSAADTIDMTLSANATNTGKIMLVAWCVDLNA